MGQLKSLVQDYYKTFEEGDYTRMRTFLHDDFDFMDPFHEIQSGDEYIAEVKALSVFDHTFNIVKVLESDEEIIVRFNWDVSAPIKTSIPMTEWFVVKDGKFAKSELFFDSKQFDELLKFLPSPVA